MIEPYYNKDDVLSCKACGDNILKIARDIVEGERVVEAMFDRTFGQAPWNDGDAMNCRNCGERFAFDQVSLKLERLL